MRQFPPDLTRLVRNLLRFGGRDPAGFEARLLDDGTVAVRGPFACAYYQVDGWTSKFVRHLHAGYFEPQPSWLAAPHAA